MAKCAACGKELAEDEISVVTINKETGECTLSFRRDHPSEDYPREIGPLFICLVHQDCLADLLDKMK